MTSQLSLNSENRMPAKDVNDFKFHRLEKDVQYTDLQVIIQFQQSLINWELKIFVLKFKAKEPAIPVKQICIALFMFITGTTMIVIGALLMSGHIDAKVTLIRIKAFMFN